MFFMSSVFDREQVRIVEPVLRLTYLLLLLFLLLNFCQIRPLLSGLMLLIYFV